MARQLGSKEYWDNEAKVQRNLKKKMFFEKTLSKYLKKADKTAVAIEIGCVPGFYLGYVCKNFGYFPEGIDFAKNTNEITAQTLGQFGLTSFNIFNEDFLKWQPKKRYDVVLSFGFIEHFIDIEPVIRKHISLLKEKGQIVLGIPNFAFCQKILHLALDRENLSRHNTVIMNLSFFENLAKDYNLQVSYLGYSGGFFKFWWDNSNPNVLQKTIYFVLRIFGRFASKIALNNKFLSPYILMIASKT